MRMVNRTRPLRAALLLALRRAVACVLLLLGAFAMPSAAAAASDGAEPGRRVALVIGNARYAHVDSLANPANDAAAMKAALEAQGFETMVGVDLDRAAFEALLSRFEAAAKGAEAALVHYSGHAFQLRGRNYLVPVDARLRSVDDIERETLRLDVVVGELQARERQLLVFLDACRNNPLPAAKRTGTGLAPVATGNGVYVAFATQPGNISYDGRSRLSPFTKAIVKNIGKPGRSVSDLMIEVRNDVERSTLHQQTPWDQSSLKRQFYFAPVPETGADGPVVAALPETGARGADVATTARAAVLPPADGGRVALLAPETVPDAVPGAGPNTVPDAVPQAPAPNVIELDEAPAEVFGREELVLAVQEELKRIGCYRADVDGMWGPGSRKALGDYYRTRKLNPTDTQPTRFHLANLRREEGRVCAPPPPPVVRERVRPAPARTARRPAARRKAAPRRAAPRRAAKPQPQRQPKRARKRTATKRAAPARKRAASGRAAPARKRKSLANVSGFGGTR